MLIQKVIELSRADGRDMSKYSVNGEGEYSKAQTAAIAVKMTIKELIENQGVSLQQAIDRINEIKPKGETVKCIIVSSDVNCFEEKRRNDVKVETSKGNFDVYVRNAWNPDSFGVFIVAMNEKFNNEEEKKERLSEISVTGQKKVETLMKEFNEKFPYLQLCIFPKAMMEESSKTPVDRTKTIAQVRIQDPEKTSIDISIHGRKLVKNLETEFLENYGLYVEVCYYDKDGHGFYTSGSYDDLNLTTLNKTIEEKGGLKDKWY